MLPCRGRIDPQAVVAEAASQFGNPANDRDITPPDPVPLAGRRRGCLQVKAGNWNKAY
jgi:hypothetical protein